MLCSACVTEHQDTPVTSGHSIFDVEIEKDIGCKEHPDEMIRFYCEPCETCVCIVCTFKEHRQHKVTQFSQAVANYKHIMQNLVTQCQTKITSFDEHIASLSKCEKVIAEVRMKIRQTAHAFLDEIHVRERLILEELDDVYGKECIENLSQKSDLSNNVESLRSTCKLAETILHGKDIELLLLRKDVQEKLSLLNQIDLKSLPPTINKTVEFVSGSIEFGSLSEQNATIKNNKDSKSVKKVTAQLVGINVQKSLSTSKCDNKISKELSDSDADDDDDGDMESDESSLSDATSSSCSHLETGIVQKTTITKNHGMQTEQILLSLTSDRSCKPEMIDQMTMTNSIAMQDKAINTRARSMLKSQKLSNIRSETSGEGERICKKKNSS